jgi:Polyprenyl synthetase
MLSSVIYHLPGLVNAQFCTCTKICLFYIYEQISINDSFILESCVYKILKRYLGREKYYSQLVDLFIETTRQTELGQLLDLTSQPLVGAIDLNRFTLERYR